MKSKKTIEFYLNGKLFKTSSYDRWDHMNDYIIHDILNKRGYVEVYDHELYEDIPDNGKLFINAKKLKCVLFTWKVYSGHKDGKGNKIYLDDVVDTPYGFQSKISEMWGYDDTYYVRRSSKTSWGWSDYTIYDWNDFKKVKDVNGTPKKYWNEPETIGLEILK